MLNWYKENGKHLGFDDAEADYEYKEGLKPEGELDKLMDVLTDDDEDAYWDMVAHERLEARMGW